MQNYNNLQTNKKQKRLGLSIQSEPLLFLTFVNEIISYD